MDFPAEKQRLLADLRAFDERLAAAEKATEVDLGQMREMLAHACSAVAAERFSIALFGAFSDGKTMIVSALLGRSDLRTGPEPCTDDITEIATGDYTIVDTPGLFPIGLMHEERTRKYISEANLILFVLSPQNPLKESHRGVVAWLLNDLGKLNATVFVVNKMDEVADVEDPEDFDETAGIKREVVFETLARYVGKPVSPAVVCVAADPRRKGLAYWLAHPEQYAPLSRIGDLRDRLDVTMKEAKRTLILRAGLDVLREARPESLDRIRDAIRALDEQLKVAANSRREISEEIEAIEEDSRQAWKGLMTEFENERKRLILGINNQADAGKLRDYVMAEIGKDGDELLRRVDRLITDYAEPLVGSARRRMENIDASLRFEMAAAKKVFAAVTKVGGKLGTWLARQSTRALADTILNMNRAAKFTKFKPWGAVKIANKFKTFGKILVFVGPVLDVLSVALTVWSDRQLQKKKAELVESVDGFFQEIRDDLTLAQLRAECCPGLEETQKVFEGLGKEQSHYQAVRDKLEDAERAITEFHISE